MVFEYNSLTMRFGLLAGHSFHELALLPYHVQMWTLEYFHAFTWPW